MSRHDKVPSAHRSLSPVVRHEIQIDHVCNAAICEEIGDRLRIKLTGKPGRLPRHILMLVEQMPRNDCFQTKTKSQ